MRATDADLSMESRSVTDRTRHLTPEEVEVRADELLGLLDRALASSALAERRRAHVEHLDGRLRFASACADQFVMVSDGPAGEAEGFALGLRGSSMARLPGAIEERHLGFAAQAMFVWWIAVDPHARRDHRGSELLGELVDTSGCARAWLLVHRDNDPAIALYRANGWDLLGEDRSDLVFGRHGLPAPRPCHGASADGSPPDHHEALPR